MTITRSPNSSTYKDFCSVRDVQYYEALTSNPFAPGDKYIFDVYVNSNFISRFKVYPDANGKGVFEVAQVVKNYIDQKKPMEGYVSGNVYKDSTFFHYEVQVGEELLGVEFLALATHNGYLHYGEISSRDYLAADNGKVLDADNFTSDFGMVQNRKYYVSDDSITLIPFMPYSLRGVLGSAATFDVDVIECTDDINFNPFFTGAQSFLSNDLVTANYFIFNQADTSGTIGWGYGTDKKNFLVRLDAAFSPQDTLKIQYLCKPFLELYYINSFGFYEQFIFTYWKELTNNEKSTYRNRDNFSFQNRSNRIYDKVTSVKKTKSYKAVKQLDSQAEYDAFAELIASHSVYLFQPNLNKFLPISIEQTSTDGYNQTYDKVQNVELNFVIWN